MAFLRIVRPYQPVDPELFRDLGPSNGRVHGQRFGTRGSTVNGTLVVGISARHLANAAQREYLARMREMFPATTPKDRARMAARRAAK